MSFQNPDRTWKEVQQTGYLCDTIKNIQDYSRQWHLNDRNVQAYLESRKTPYLNSSEILEVHRLSFNGITTFNGQYCQTQMAYGGYLGAVPSAVSAEFSMLDRQMNILWKNAKTQEAKLRTIAFQHSRLIAIHGFLDGNGRVSRVATDFALYHIGRDFPIINMERNHYIQANNSAIEHNNIGWLTKVLSVQYDLKYTEVDLHIAPFKIAPFQNAKKLSLENSQFFSEKSINQNSMRYYYLNVSDLSKIIQKTDGKPGKNFGDVMANISRLIEDQPLSIGESIQKIQSIKNSGAIKKRFFNSINENAYTEFAREHFQFVTQFASPEKKSEFWYLIEKQIDGQASAQDIDNYVSKLNSEVPGKAYI